MSSKMEPVIISDKDLQELIGKRAQTLLGLAGFLIQEKSTEKILTRPLLGQLLSQSVEIEELLDAYDAKNNCRWCAFRSLTAGIKLFSDVGYELLHIEHALPAYRLMEVEYDFEQATKEALAFVGHILLRAAEKLLDKAVELDLPVPSKSVRERAYAEHLPPGRLARDCASRHVEAVSETVSLLSTAFLNLAAESKDVRAAAGAKPEQYCSFASNSVTEEKLRNLQLRFHNLQSLYDTYVSGTEAEENDEDLLVLRGHISVVFHLFKTATLFSHYYERLIQGQRCELPCRQQRPGYMRCISCS